MTRGLLVGRHSGYLGKLAETLCAEDISLFIATNLEDVKRILEREAIDTVFLENESDTAYRLQVLRHIFALSPGTSIHLLGSDVDPARFIGKMLL